MLIKSVIILVNKNIRYTIVQIGLLLIFLIAINLVAKSSPITQQARLLAFKRAKSLNKGISISWLEQTWAENTLAQNTPTKADFMLLKKLGFKSIRLPVAFTSFSPKITTAQLFTYIDKVIKQCDTYGFKLVIDYHYGRLSDNNYLTETPQIIDLWLKLTKRYKYTSYNNLFFEIYNEPPHISPKVWKDAAYNIVTAIRKTDGQRTLIVGASNYNSIYELSRFERLADDNIIYTFHFYEPFFFTHQGAAWVGDQVATTGVSFPYNAENFPTLNPKAKNTPGQSNYRMYPRDGNEQSINDKLQIVKNWALKYDVPIICGEYGVYNKYADLDSRCRYIKAVRRALKRLEIPGMLWDYNSTFSLFTGKPALETLSSCMMDAISDKP